MRKLFTLGTLLLLGVVALGPSQGQAFNSATHIYIVEWVFPFTPDKINLYYGSIAPDVALYVEYPENWPHAFCETHYKFIKLPYPWWNLTQKAFAKGWQTHNEIWGADFYAHGTFFTYDSCVSFEDCDQDNCDKYWNYNGYVNVQAGTLQKEFEILKSSALGFELAHFAIEVAIDVLLVRYQDPSLGLKLLSAAKYRSQKDLDLMVSTFAKDQETTEALKAAEDTFRGLVIDYATALSLPDPFRMFAISELGVQVAEQMGVTVTAYEVWEILRVAMFLCQNSNYMEVVQSAIEGIRTNPDLIR